ncbi:MAG: hypothetical protein K5894_08360 [Lachnospiraceae bacterium]|nr:hypothetical protein [Lachnospiraceae bacterium]
MKRVVFTNNRYMTKTQYKTLRKIEDELEKEMFRQISIICGCAGIALFENWGWKKQRISKIYREICEVWRLKPNEESMIGICEKETGITIGIPEYDGNYQDLKFFQGDSNIEDLTMNQRIYMRQRQKRWMGAEIFASLMIALHRTYGFGSERISRVYSQIVEVRDRYNWDSKLIDSECNRITGVGMPIR